MVIRAWAVVCGRKDASFTALNGVHVTPQTSPWIQSEKERAKTMAPIADQYGCGPHKVVTLRGEVSVSR